MRARPFRDGTGDVSRERLPHLSRRPVPFAVLWAQNALTANGWALLLGPVQARDATNQFPFLTLRLKSGAVTLEKALAVSGTLQPQQDSTEVEPLVVTLEQAGGGACWSLAIDDRSVQRQ